MPGFGRDILHRRRMEAGPREDALRRIEDADWRSDQARARARWR
jgi:hypothetical protein